MASAAHLPSKPPIWKRRWVLGSAGGMVLAAAVWGGMTWWNKPVDVSKLSIEQIQQVTQSPGFRQMPREQQRQYRMAEFEARVNKTMDEYFALPMGPQRDKYMDGVINEMETRMRQWQAMAATRPTSRPTTGPVAERGNRGRNMDPADRIKSRLENTPPDRRARVAAFMDAMRKRRAERGLPPDPFPGRGGPRR